MKKKLTILLLSFFILSIGYGQISDSVRTRNDKPGTPQSLRTPNTAPRNHIHTINKNVPPQQSVNHDGIETNEPNNQRNKEVIAPNSTNNKTVPVTPVTIKPGLTPQDTSKNSKGVMQNGQGNASNPIRK